MIATNTAFFVSIVLLVSCVAPHETKTIELAGGDENVCVISSPSEHESFVDSSPAGSISSGSCPTLMNQSVQCNAPAPQEIGITILCSETLSQ